MKFFAVNGSRPARLCEETRRFAFESLNFKYGLDAEKTPFVALDNIEGFADLSATCQYDLAVLEIAKTAPIRICEGEKISGAATLGGAIGHNVPATFGGKPVVCSSVSHLTIDFETVLKKGVNHIKSQAEAAFKLHLGTKREAFAQSCLNCLAAFEIWHSRYLTELEDKEEYANNYRNLKVVPFEPANSFYEAVQSIWFVFAFARLCGNWPGIGRLDYLLGEYLKRDLKNGVLTLDEAREILAHFFIKGCEWIRGGNRGSGDAQHYQNIVLGGIDDSGKEVTNEVTYLVLDIIEELGISDFPTTVRINKNTDDKLLRRVAEVVKLGGGVIAVYNEELIIDSLVNYGYELSEARKFANDGCWEIQIPGKTYFTYIPFDALQLFQNRTLNGYDENLSFDSFEALLNRFILDLKEKVDEIISDVCNRFEDDLSWKPQRPCTVVSLFEQGCIGKGLSYLEGGPVYNTVSPHIGGLPDVVNSLYAIKKLVFDEKKVSFYQLMKLLKSNWEGNEELRLYALKKLSYFGNDNDEVDFLAREIVNKLADFCDETKNGYPCRFPAGISTFGRQIAWSHQRMATPYGKRANEFLAGNFSPTPGTDTQGATAIIKSYCKSDLRRTVSGAALDIKLLPSAVSGEHGIDAICGLIKGFVTLGGHFMQLDIADVELLRAAQENPEKYSNLSVRVSGWNARFVTLNEEWQNMIIEQTGSNI